VTPVEGGYSRNRRSIVTNGETSVFVKEVDLDLLPNEGEEELGWLKKEYLCATKLRETLPEIVPEFSVLDESGDILVTSAFPAEVGWHWTPPTDPAEAERYMHAVIEQVDVLENISWSQEDIETLKLQPYFRDELAFDDGIDLILHNEAIRTQILDKFQAMSHTSVLKQQFENIIELFQNHEALLEIKRAALTLKDQPNDAFGHCDVRSDNLCFNATTGEIKFVDWNWASFTPKGFGATEFLTDMARRGYDVTPFLSELNQAMLASLVGFYAKRCIKDPLTPGNTLHSYLLC